MQKLVVTLPKKMPLAMRISKASSQIREWLQIVDVAFNDERDKLQLTKWQLKNSEYHYHYSIKGGIHLAQVDYSAPEASTISR